MIILILKGYAWTKAKVYFRIVTRLILKGHSESVFQPNINLIPRGTETVSDYFLIFKRTLQFIFSISSMKLKQKAIDIHFWAIDLKKSHYREN